MAINCNNDKMLEYIATTYVGTIKTGTVVFNNNLEFLKASLLNQNSLKSTQMTIDFNKVS